MDENKPAASAPARSGAGRAAGATARTAVSAPAGLPDPLAGLRIAGPELLLSAACFPLAVLLTRLKGHPRRKRKGW